MSTPDKPAKRERSPAGRPVGVVGRTAWDLAHEHWKAIAIGALVVIALAGVMLVVGARFFGLQYSFTKEGVNISFGSAPAREILPPPVFEKWHGYYGDFDDKLRTYIGVEALDVSFDQTAKSFRAKSSGKWTQPDGEVVAREWKSDGFFDGERLSGSFISQGSNFVSIGVFYLQAPTDGEYAGVVMFYEWFSKGAVICPYVLAKRELTVEKAKERWPKVLGQACRTLNVDDLT